MEHYQPHLEVLAERWQAALSFAGFDLALIAAGEPRMYFLDDHGPPFRPNPHFAQWFPQTDCAHSALLVEPGRRPRLFFHQPRDFWHQPPTVPDWAAAHMDASVFHDLEDLHSAVATALGRSNRSAFIGENPPGNLTTAAHNPALLLNHLHYYRAYKTEFEITRMAEANARAAAGHVAAREAFEAGASEFECHLRYLTAARQTEEDLPYHSIVAQNRHAGVLHYQHYDRQPPRPLRSFLIDAGATADGYAADVTRTYASAEVPEFAALVDAMDSAQQRIISEVRPGIDYAAVHEAAHQAVAGVLAGHGLVRCSAEAAYETGLTRTFLPHGVGHLIGLQTHDVGGQQISPEGGMRPPPEHAPALRLTRTVEERQVFTIEPGLYFIPMLLESARAATAADQIDWERVDRLEPCGGIRIEDNVVVTADGTRNLTREAFDRTPRVDA